ncbi:MAG: hypothetical protein ACR2LF_13955 [Jatrophihabitantaceae bacterium]
MSEVLSAAAERAAATDCGSAPATSTPIGRGREASTHQIVISVASTTTRPVAAAPRPPGAQRTPP